jgi:hypothetical protein
MPNILVLSVDIEDILIYILGHHSFIHKTLFYSSERRNLIIVRIDYN